MLDVQSIRKDFPILDHKIYDKPLIYFDNGATTQKPRCVVEKIESGYYNVNANIHRGVHFLSQAATEAHEDARKTVQQFLNARSSNEIIFTRGTTEAINLIASSFTDECMSAGDEVIVSVMEHHSNIVPWQIQAARKGITLKVIPMNEKGELCMDTFRSLFSERTKLVSVTHVSNVLGTINPVKEIIEEAHNHEVPVLIDGAQAVPHLKVDVQDLDAEFYVFSGHKIYGPTGIGVLYGKEEWLDKLPPYQGGGEMIASVSFEKTTFNELPFKFEAGTPDYIGSTALAEALRYVGRLGMGNIAAYEDELLRYATDKLNAIDGMRIFGQAAHKGAVLSFLVGNIHHYDMGMLLDRLGIAVRTGHHCAQPLMQDLGIEGTVRASFSFYNTKEEIDAFAAGIERVRKMKKESRKSRKWGAACVALAGFLLFLCILQFFHIDSLLTRTGLGLAIAALLYLAYSLFRHRKTEVEQVVTEPEEQAIRRQQWNVDRLKQELGQKQTVLSNLQSEYEELCISMTEKDHLQEELDALSLAGETIQSLSVQMQSRIGDRLKQQMSKTLSSLTNGRYLQVNMDENLRIGLHTADEYVPLEQVSRGTIEQAYFALRMAAMDVLCGEEELPVILDESFAFYDENRLKETLKWLAENRTQVLLFTCQKREEEALSEMGIPYRKIVL